jgi:hypothetical protein
MTRHDLAAARSGEGAPVPARFLKPVGGGRSQRPARSGRTPGTRLREGCAVRGRSLHGRAVGV